MNTTKPPSIRHRHSRRRTPHTTRQTAADGARSLQPPRPPGCLWSPTQRSLEPLRLTAPLGLMLQVLPDGEVYSLAAVEALAARDGGTTFRHPLTAQPVKIDQLRKSFFL